MEILLNFPFCAGGWPNESILLLKGGYILKSKRDEIRKRRMRNQRLTRLGWTAAALLLVAVIGYGVWNANRPIGGEAVPIMSDTTHVEEGSDPGPYNSNPPTSGRHYPSELDADFYESNDYQYPAGYLVHNLEHGYVIFWYNCEQAPDGQCEALKADIRSVLEAENYNKVIAYPWDSIDEPVVLTSWGQILPMDSFDAQAARTFVTTNRNKAPEPNAP